MSTESTEMNKVVVRRYFKETTGRVLNRNMSRLQL